MPSSMRAATAASTAAAASANSSAVPGRADDFACVTAKPNADGDGANDDDANDDDDDDDALFVPAAKPLNDPLRCSGW